MVKVIFQHSCTLPHPHAVGRPHSARPHQWVLLFFFCNTIATAGIPMGRREAVHSLASGSVWQVVEPRKGTMVSFTCQRKGRLLPHQTCWASTVALSRVNVLDLLLWQTAWQIASDMAQWVKVLVSKSESNPWDTHTHSKRRELSPTGLPLTYIHALQHP